MKNNWSKSFANKYIKKYKKLGFSKDLALRVYTTRLLGRNKELVLHGGGNTSVKTSIKDIDGKSFTRLVRGKKMDRGPIYWHFPQYSNHGMQSPGGAIRDGDYKLLEYFENGTVQLFNLANDIGEQKDLSKIEIQKSK